MSQDFPAPSEHTSDVCFSVGGFNPNRKISWCFLQSSETKYYSTSWWLNQPMWKIWVKLGSSSLRFGVKSPKIFETATTQLDVKPMIWNHTPLKTNECPLKRHYLNKKCTTQVVLKISVRSCNPPLPCTPAATSAKDPKDAASRSATFGTSKRLGGWLVGGIGLPGSKLSTPYINICSSFIPPGNIEKIHMGIYSAPMYILCTLYCI